MTNWRVLAKDDDDFDVRFADRVQLRDDESGMRARVEVTPFGTSECVEVDLGGSAGGYVHFCDLDLGIQQLTALRDAITVHFAAHPASYFVSYVDRERDEDDGE